MKQQWSVPIGWTKGEDLEFRWMGQTPTLWRAAPGNSGPSSSELVMNEVAAMHFHSAEECNRFAEWWFDLQPGRKVRTIWSAPSFQYRPQTGSVIEGEVMPGSKGEYTIDGRYIGGDPGP